MRASDFTGNPLDDEVASARVRQAELVVDRKSGRVRQAGASTAEGRFIMDFRARCEKSLYCFLDGILNYHFLQPELHKAVCDWLTTIPPYRKMLLMPRNHGKSTIVARGIPLHMLIQPAEGNIYFKGPGSELRCVLAAETEQRAIEHFRVIRGALENNVLLRALWPQVVWDNPSRQAGKWSDTELIVPRKNNYPEVTIHGVGVGGAITGKHPNVLIKDDLTTQRASNEPPTMQKAIEWHQDSRALFANPDTDIEFITGTYWAAYDLPNWIEANDKTVEVNTRWRRIVEDGQVIYPLKYGYPGAVEQAQKESGVKFTLLYMNTVIGSALTDFNLADLRYYERRGNLLVYNEDDRDVALTESINGPPRVNERSLRGWPLSDVMDLQQVEYLRRVRSG